MSQSQSDLDKAPDANTNGPFVITTVFSISGCRTSGFANVPPLPRWDQSPCGGSRSFPPVYGEKCYNRGQKETSIGCFANPDPLRKLKPCL